MSLETILKRIEENVSLACQEILARAQEEKRAKIDKAQEEAKETERRILEAAREEALRIKAMAASRADSIKRQMILSAKAELLASVFDEALRRLGNMPPQDYREMLLDLIGASSHGDETIILEANDKPRLGDGFEDGVRERLRALGKKDGVAFEYRETPLGGGFILKKGGTSWNFTFPAVINLLKDELEIEVARIVLEGLHGEGE